MRRSAPRFVIIAGPNGAGKSTIASAPDAMTLLRGTAAINPDTHATAFRAKHALLPDAANLLAVVQTELEVWRSIAEGRSVAVETVLSTDKYLPAIRAARMRGFETVLIYIAVPSVEYSIQRVQARVTVGGHDVPEANIRRRWPRTLANFTVFMNEADEVALFSNAGAEPILVGKRSAPGSFELYYRDELPEITALLNEAQR